MGFFYVAIVVDAAMNGLHAIKMKSLGYAPNAKAQIGTSLFNSAGIGKRLEDFMGKNLGNCTFWAKPLGHVS